MQCNNLSTDEIHLHSLAGSELRFRPAASEAENKAGTLGAL